MSSALQLHHVGFVVSDIEQSMPKFIQSMDGVWDGMIFEDPHQKVKVAFLTTRPGDAQIELVEPAGEDAPVRRFLEERGGGLHHLCYEIADLETQLALMRKRGALIAKKPKPAVAFNGRRIAWVITAESLLVEYLEAEQPA